MTLNGTKAVIRAALNEGFNAHALMIKGYTNTHGEKADVIVDTNASYTELVKSSIAMMALVDPAEIAQETGVDVEICRAAHAELLGSLRNTVELGAGNNPAYSHGEAKRGEDATYETLSHGVKLHLDSGCLHVSGIVIGKRKLVEGTYPVVNSRPKTVAKDAMRDRLPLAKWRQYKLTPANVEAVVLGDKTFAGSDFASGATAAATE